MSGQNIIFNNNSFRKIKGFDKTVIFGEDVELTQRAARAGLKGVLITSLFHKYIPRRIEKNGRFNAWKKYIKGTWHILFYGPIRKPLFEYKMGGKVQ